MLLTSKYDAACSGDTYAEYIAAPMHKVECPTEVCHGCVASTDKELCNKLPDCVTYDVIWLPR